MRDSDDNTAVQNSTEITNEKRGHKGRNAGVARSEQIADSSAANSETENRLHPEFRQFLDRVIIPALADKYMEEIAKPLLGSNRPRADQSAVRREFFTIQQLAERWSCSRGMVYNVLRSTGTKVVDFAARGHRGRKLVPIAAVEQIERKKLRTFR